MFGATLPTVEQWRFTQAGRIWVVRAQGNLRASDNEVLRLAALAGQGVALQPSFRVGEALREGKLVQILSAYDAGCVGIYVVQPNRRAPTAKVRSFVDLLLERWGNDERDPFWRGPQVC